MRVSARDDDPGYANWLRLGQKVKAFLDDKLMPAAVTADEEAGLLLTRLCDENGHLIVDRYIDVDGSKRPVIREVWMSGVVRVEPCTPLLKQPAWMPADKAKPRVHPPLNN